MERIGCGPLNCRTRVPVVLLKISFYYEEAGGDVNKVVFQVFQLYCQMIHNGDFNPSIKPEIFHGISLITRAG